jgi:hypothetical protein
MGLILVSPFEHYRFLIQTKADVFGFIKTALESVNWTTVNSFAVAEGTMGGGTGMADGDTLTIDGVTFTARNVPTLTNDFQIGANATATAANAVAVINAVSVTVTSTSVGGTIFLTAVTSGPGSNSIALSESGAFTWSTPTLISGGYRFQTPVTDEGLPGLTVWLRDRGYSNGGAAGLALSIESTDGTLVQTDDNNTAFEIGMVGGRTMGMLCNPTGFFTYLPNSESTGGGTNFAAFTLAVGARYKGVLVSNATDDGGGLILITTSSPHGLVTGQIVNLSGINGVPANGSWTITVTSPTTFTLDGSTFSGAYISGGSAAGPGKVSQVAAGFGDRYNGVSTAHLRSNILAGPSGGNTGTDIRILIFNNNKLETYETDDQGRIRMSSVEPSFLHHTGAAVFHEPWFMGNVADRTSPPVFYGLVPNCAILNAAHIASDADADEPFQDDDNNIWWRYTWNQSNGCLCILCPGTLGTPPTALITTLT